jgi:molybdopterin biosynthesis enzyme
MQGLPLPLPRLVKAAEAVPCGRGRTGFVRACVDALGRARPAEAPAGQRLSSLAKADGWLELPPGGLRLGATAPLWQL